MEGIKTGREEMKPSMLFAIIMLAAIVIATAFGLSFGGAEKVVTVPAAFMGQELYVCPANVQPWTSISQSLHPLTNYFIIGFFFAVILLMFSWGWALYQNLLKDEFKKDAYTKSWSMTKMLFWVTVIILLLSFTPNHFRTVRIHGDNRQWVLCENTNPKALAVKAEAVYR